MFTGRSNGGRPETSAPPSSILPSSGRSKPAIMRSVVVLPEPDGPSIVKNSPRAMSRSTPSTAATSPYRFRRPTTRMSMSDGSCVSHATAASDSSTGPQSLLELVVRDRQRGQQPDHVAVDAAGQEQQAALEGRIDDRLRPVGRLLRRARTRASARGRAPRRSRDAARRSPRAARAAARPSRAAPARNSGSRTASSTATAAAHESGLPPNVPPSPPGGTASISSARPVTAASGSPPPIDLPETSRSGSTPS